MPSLSVPFNDFPQQYIQQKERLRRAFDRVAAKGDFILGEAVQDFEHRFADLCDVEHAIGVGSGTDALIIALKILGIGPGDEVITVPNSWISTASSIALTGATPVFVDVGEDMNMAPELFETAITPATKAVIPVHLTGNPANMNEIVQIADRYGIPVVEDAAQAVGGRYRNKPVGSWGTLGCFSLHPLKNLNASGDAGVIVCQDEGWAGRARLLRNHGLIDRDHVDEWGLCSRLDTIQAAILNERLNTLSEVENNRRATADFYTACLENIVEVPIEHPDAHHVYHTYIIQTDFRDELATFLSHQGIKTKIHYPIPIHLQKAAAYLGYNKGDFPVVEKQSLRILSLPIHQYLSSQQKEHVVQSIRDFHKHR